jgi:hypothetical protein
LIAAIIVIALVRDSYLRDVGDSGIGPLLGMVAFGLINLLVFGGATAASFAYHDPRTLRKPAGGRARGATGTLAGRAPGGQRST